MTVPLMVAPPLSWATAVARTQQDPEAEATKIFSHVPSLPPAGFNSVSAGELAEAADLSMLAEHAAQAVGNLADRGIYAGGIQNGRHQISVPRAARSSAANFSATGSGSGGTHFASAPPATFERRVQTEGRHDPLFLFLEAVHSHHDSLAAFDAHLIIVRGILDLVLDVPVSMAPAYRPLPRWISGVAHAAFDGIGQTFDVLAAAHRIDGIGDADSCAMICWVRSAMRADSSVGSARASSRELVCRDCAPPSTAAMACSAVRTMLTSGCCAVSVTPPSAHGSAASESADLWRRNGRASGGRKCGAPRGTWRSPPENRCAR